MSNWKPIETAPENVHVLVRYFKAQATKKHSASKQNFFITEAYLKPMVTHTEYKDYLGNLVRYSPPLITGGEWMDYAERVLVDTKAKKSRNFLTHWQPLPEEP